MNVLALVLAMTASMLDWSELKRGEFAFPKQDAFIEDCANPDHQYVFSFCGLQAGKTVSQCDGAFAALYLAKNPVTLPPGMIGQTCMEV